MREIDHQESGSPLRFKPWFIILVGSVCLLVGVSIGRAFFPLEVPKPFIVEKEKRVEVPVDRIVEKRVPVEVIKYVERVVERRVEVPFEVVKYVDRAVLSDRTPQVPFPKAPTISSTAIDAASWKKLSVGMSPESVRNLLGAPKQVGGSSFILAFADTPARIEERADCVYWYYLALGEGTVFIRFEAGKVTDFGLLTR